MILDLSREPDWLIATALRGPDDEDAPWEVKSLTTCVIRFFIEASATSGRTQWPTRTPAQARARWEEMSQEGRAEVRGFMAKHSAHFGWHVAAALQALDMLKVAGAAEHQAWLEEIVLLAAGVAKGYPSRNATGYKFSLL